MTTLAVAVTFAARLGHIIHRQLALAHIVARLRGDRAALPALVVQQALDLAVRVLGRAGCAALVEGADAALLAVGAGNLLCGGG